MPPSPTHLPIVAMLLAIMALGGCSRFTGGRTPKYQTVVANNHHDTATAKQKHREALVFLEDLQYGRDFKKAHQLLDEALVADVTYGPAHNSLGSLYFIENKLYLAAWEFEYAAKLMPELAQPYNNLGLVYERVGKYDEAISYYSMGLSRAPNDPEMIGNLVRTRLLNGDRSPELKQMMSDLALHHTQPRWQRWARDQVELMKFEAGEASLTNSSRIPDTAPEMLPVPIPEESELPVLLTPLRQPEEVLPQAGQSAEVSDNFSRE